MLFNKRLLKQKINKLDLTEIHNITSAKETLTKWQTALMQSDLDKTKETGVQGQFLIKIFEGVLGYRTQSEGGSEWNMFAEPKTDVDSREADGGLGFFSTSSNQTRVVIELKDAKTNLDAKQKGRKNDQSPVEQAFDYLSKFDGCKWAIVSNFKEIRLYSKERGQGFYESIDLLEIGNEEVLRKFLFLFSKENLINRDRDSVIDDLLKDSFVKEQDISKAFYKTYKETRNHLFNHLSSNNPNIDADILLEKAQKILDRVIFICFCEDLDLIPAGIFRKLLEAAKLSFAPSETKVWDQAKGLFHSIDKGNPPLNINKFNGGLFKGDQVLDNLVIKDEIILELLKLSEYDFDSDLNVNILGHIFEQSISDLEGMRSEITEEQTEKNGGKRKKDGIFYTPEYITRYIVEQAVGGWLMDRKRELGFESLPELTDKDFKSIKTRKGTYKGNNSIEKHRKFWEAYKEKLRDIKVLDPACGSGAFLNQVFDYLYKEGQVVNDALASLKLGQGEIFDLDKHILNNNIFGVDLNEESVQITKLSLWLKTANKSKELTTLDENIKCGNSLVDDPQIVGEKAFNWKEEFKDIFYKGGFDVVVGNPPYVRQELLGEFKSYFSKNYEVFNFTSDLFAYFYEKAFQLLNKNGLFGFISNTFDKTTAGVDLRKYLKENISFVNYIDFTGVQIFDGATTYPIILIGKNSSSNIGEFNYIKVPTNIKTVGFDITLYNSIKVKQNTLDDNSWNFKTDDESTILSKILRHKTIRELYGKSYYGIKTGFNEAFIINKDQKDLLIQKDISSAELIKPFYEGKDILKWNSPPNDKYLIFTRRGTNIESYPAIYEWLNTFRTKLEPKTSPEQKEGRKPGTYKWFEIQDSVDYYKYFEAPKITWANLQAKNKFCFDDKGYYINAPSVIFPSDNKVLLALLNSKLCWFFLKSICVVRSGGYIEVKPQYFEQIPIPSINEDARGFLEQKVEETINIVKQRQDINNQFIRFLKSKYPNILINKKLEAWFNLDFSIFIQELSKQKIKLSISDQNDWMSHIENIKTDYEKLSTLQNKIEVEIDSKIYELYGLDETEIKIIKDSFI